MSEPANTEHRECRVHPVVRIFASQTDADGVRAVERDEKVQHTVEWHVEPGESMEVMDGYFDMREYVSTLNAKIATSSDGAVTVELPVFVRKAAFPRRFERVTTPGHIRSNWNGEKWRGVA